MVPGPLSNTHRDSVASLNSVDTSGLQDDLYSNAPLFPASGSDDVSSQIEGYNLPQQGPYSVASDAEHEESDNGNRKRNDNLKDPKAAKRLRKQRKIDRNNLKEMRKILIPEGVGKVYKKDLTTMCTS